jgi:hypothetical protein
MFFSCGFTETFDFKAFEEDWLQADFDDDEWRPAEMLGGPTLFLPLRLKKREIPFLLEEPEEPGTAEKGRFSVKGLHCIDFRDVIPEGENALGFAQTCFFLKDKTNSTLRITSDDAFKAFANDELVLEQAYDEEFVRTRRWYGEDVYEQHHHGHGPFKESAPVALKPGWNKVFVAVDHASGGWGFTLALLDEISGSTMNLPFSDVKDPGDEKWTVAGPFESTGLNDSLDDLRMEIVEEPLSDAEARRVRVDPFGYEKVTDYARLMRAEERTGIIKADPRRPIVLNQGEFALFDFGQVKVGFPVLEIDSPGPAILDVGYNYVVRADRKVRFLYDLLRYVDRVFLKKGRQEWEPLERRTSRYLHVSCRQGGGVQIRGVRIKSLVYPVPGETARFASSDSTLNRIWKVSSYTTRLLMQYGYQDCLRREEGVCNMSSFNYMSRAAGYCFGDFALARKTIRLAGMTQNDTGWFDSHGLSSLNNDEQSQCFWWIVWLKDYFLHSADLSLIEEQYDTVRRCLNYFSKSQNRYGLLDNKNDPLIHRGQTPYVDDTLFSIPEYRSPFAGELFGTNILYYAALNSAAYLAEVTDHGEQGRIYRRKAHRVAESCNERFWDGSKGLYSDWREGDTLASTNHQALLIAALYFQVCDKEKTAAVLNHLLNLRNFKGGFANYHLTFGFYYYFLEVLFRHGQDIVALELMRAYYGSWLETGATTFGEFFDWKQDIADEEYEVHGYGTSAHLHFCTNILGIRPLAPGFREVLLAPHPGDLRHAEGAVNTPAGLIEVQWRVDKSGLRMEITLPQSCGYELAMPKGPRSYRVELNGEIVQARE